jgi:hypothetical protein
VRFILVGGVAAVIEGAPVATFDVDIVPDRERRNVDRLVAALTELRAHYRGRPAVHPLPEAQRGAGHHLLMTLSGPLDVLGIIGKERDFQALLPHAHRRVLSRSHISVLDLETQIAVKEEWSFAKDRAMIPILKATLNERRRQRR